MQSHSGGAPDAKKTGNHEGFRLMQASWVDGTRLRSGAFHGVERFRCSDEGGLRPAGIIADNLASASGFIERTISVQMNTGEIVLMRMPYRANSLAHVTVMAATPALAAE